MNSPSLFTKQRYVENVAAADTDEELLAAPGAGKRIVVLGYEISAAGVGNIWLESSTTTQITCRHETVAGTNIIVRDAYIPCAVNESLTFTSVGAGISTHSLAITYQVEG